jgi:hypothetical protein
MFALLMRTQGFRLRPEGNSAVWRFGGASATTIATESFVTRLKILNSKSSGEKRDAETTEGFFTDRTADRGGNHPDHRSYRNS